MQVRIDWSKIPDWVRYVTTEGGGMITFWSEEPRLEGDRWCGNGRMTTLSNAPFIIETRIFVRGRVNWYSVPAGYDYVTCDRRGLLLAHRSSSALGDQRVLSEGSHALDLVPWNETRQEGSRA